MSACCAWVAAELTEYTYKRIVDAMPKTKLTVLIEDALIEEMKIQAIREKRSVGEITEELWREYLKGSTGKPKKK